MTRKFLIIRGSDINDHHCDCGVLYYINDILTHYNFSSDITNEDNTCKAGSTCNCYGTNVNHIDALLSHANPKQFSYYEFTGDILKAFPELLL